MISRRSVLGTISAGGVALLAGCLEDLLDSDIDAEAEPAEFEASVVEATGFEHINTESYEIDETFDIAGEDVNLRAVSWLATYGIGSIDADMVDEEADPDDFDHLDESDVVAATAISTPSETFAGQEINPAGRYDTDELIDEFNEEISEGNVENFERVDDIEVTILDEETELSVFEADLNHQDEDELLEIALYLATVQSGDDYVITAGLHHRSIEKRDELVELVQSVEHPVDRP